MEVETLLEGLPPSAIILPVWEMERILAFGEAAVPALLSALEHWEDDEERDPLPLLVLLGEIGHPDAVEPLTKWLGRPDLELYSVAAAEALAKIGSPAIPALFRVAREEDPRHFRYGHLRRYRRYVGPCLAAAITRVRRQVGCHGGGQHKIQSEDGG